ncbi:MAG: hypothetical protein HN802_04670 [Candidatus Jacksonbacteria bacterium]|nr:hypothetical protein [Candidatus Jacksonbacteria bacterium]MBT7338966.1 hypothetical protein [Candidatus Jacksonbacteria bacterium]
MLYSPSEVEIRYNFINGVILASTSSHGIKEIASDALDDLTGMIEDMGFAAQSAATSHKSIIGELTKLFQPNSTEEDSGLQSRANGLKIATQALAGCSSQKKAEVTQAIDDIVRLTYELKPQFAGKFLVNAYCNQAGTKP